VKSKVTDLIIHLYDTISPYVHINTPIALEKNCYWVYKYEIDRLVDAYYTNDVSLDLLSEKLFISTQSIKRIIMSVYGKTFNELKLELKMRNAKRLLQETNMNISEIAKETGYSTTRGFLAAFSKYEGITPTQYRKR
jgi:two-component system response regulator YesN